MLGHSDPQMGQNSRRRDQKQPKKRACLLTVILANPKWALTLQHHISKSILIFMLKFERTGPGGHPNFTAPPLLSSEQQDSRQAESGCRGQRRQWQMDLIYEDNQNLDCQEKRKTNRSHMTKFVPSRWPFWANVWASFHMRRVLPTKNKHRIMKQVERVFGSVRRCQGSVTSSSRDPDRKVIMSFERATNHLCQHALLEKNR